jgi:hypothetical protein
MNNMYINIGANNGSEKLFAPTFIYKLFSCTGNIDRSVLVNVQIRVKCTLKSAMKVQRWNRYASTLYLADAC